jgi:hypothetical protein
MILIGFVLAVVFNVDTIRIVQALSSNPDLRKAIVEQAVGYTKKGNEQTNAAGKPGAVGGSVSQQSAIQRICRKP